MKEIKYILLTVVLLAAWSPAALAQNDAAGTTASANVITDLFVGNKINALNFGNILVGSSKYLDAGNPGGSFVDATASGTGGSVDGVTGGEELGFISIKTNSVVRIEVRLPGRIYSESGQWMPVDWSSNGQGGGIGYNLRAGVSSNYTDGSPPTTNLESVSLVKGNWNFSTISGENTTIYYEGLDIGDAGGEIFVVVGGQVNASTSQPTDVYQGDITIIATILN